MEHLTKAAKERRDPHTIQQLLSKNDHSLTPVVAKKPDTTPGDHKIPFFCDYVHTGQNEHQIPTRMYQGYKTTERMVGSSQHCSKFQYDIDFDETEVLDTIYTVFPHYERSNKNIQTPL
jgi:hypothetical protein